MDIIKILGICFTAAVLTVMLKQYKSEYAIIVSAASGTVVLIFILTGAMPLIKNIESLLGKGNIDVECFETAIKSLGIAYITGFVADTCRDFGQSALASKAELAGRCAILLLSLPLLSAVLEFALELVSL